MEDQSAGDMWAPQPHVSAERVDGDLYLRFETCVSLNPEPRSASQRLPFTFSRGQDYEKIDYFPRAINKHILGEEADDFCR